MKKELYHINPSFTQVELARINAFLSATGGTMRQYSRDAMLTHMERELQAMSEERRKAIEAILNLHGNNETTDLV